MEIFQIILGLQRLNESCVDIYINFLPLFKEENIYKFLQFNNNVIDTNYRIADC